MTGARGLTGRKRRGMALAARLLRGASLAVVALALPSVGHAQNQDRYWDANGTAVGLGGTDQWNTTSPVWNQNSDGVTGPMAGWNNGASGGDNAIFNGTAGTVTLIAPIIVHNLTFGVSGYTLTGSTLTLTGATPTITGAATINSIIAGTAGLTRVGGGILTLNGANTFSGGINITGGQFNVSGDAALGNASNGISLANGTVFSSVAALAGSRVITVTSGRATVGNGALSARITGAGGVQVIGTASNDANDYTGQTIFGQSTNGFTSIADLGVASSLGAPTDATVGTISVSAGGGLGGGVIYSGDGDSSNRNWQFNNTSSGGNSLQNSGTGTLKLTGNIVGGGGFTLGLSFSAASADIELLGVLSSTVARTFTFTGTAGRTITLGDANSYTGPTSINIITVKAGTLANGGNNSSLGSGSIINFGSGTLSYTGAGAATDRTLTISGASTISNDGTGALSLSGATSFVAGGAADTLTLGGSFAGAANSFSGVISGVGNLTMNGAGSWVVSGANSFTGATTVQGGALTAGSSTAFGAANPFVVNGGTLDLGGFDITASSLAGTGGTVSLGSNTLTLNAASGSTGFAGAITGSGGLTKLGASTLTLTGANSYTGATTIGAGTLALDFSAAGAPGSNIVDPASTLVMQGGGLLVTGTTGQAQSFASTTIAAGGNTVRGAGNVTVNLGAINRGGGVVNFILPTTGTITTTPSTVLGGWATVTSGTSTDYAQVDGSGNIVARTVYAEKDDASTWVNGDVVADTGGSANTPFFNTVSGNVQLGGLKYTAAAGSGVTVGTGNTLGVDGTVIVASSVNNAGQTISGGSITGVAGGGTLGVLNNSIGTGVFTIASTIVDNGGAISFAKGGTGRVALTGTNSYTGGTTISGGTLAVDSVANGGVASAIGASSADSANLVLESGTLQYTGVGPGTSDRGFTLVNGGPSRTIQVDSGNLSFGGVVLSSDDAGFAKTGAGTLTLANVANTYTGATTISAGILSVSRLANGGVASGIGASSSDSANLVIQTGGTLQYTGVTASTDRGFTLNGTAGGTVDVADAGTTLTVGGTIIGAGPLRKAGAGTLVLSDINTYTGQTMIDAGTLQAGSTQAFGSPNAVTLADAAGVTLDLNGFNNKVGGLSGGGANGGTVSLGGATLTIGGTNVSFSGTITGAGGLTKENTSAQTLLGCNNNYTGVTTVNGGTFSVDCLANGGQASGIGASTSASANLVLSAGAFAYIGGNATTDRGFTLVGTGTINVSNAATTLEFTGVATGTSLNKTGPGTLILSGTNTYNGATFANGGIVQAGSTSAFGTSGLRMDTTGATLDLHSFNNSVAYISQANLGVTGGNITLGSATLTINDGSGGNYNGGISGSGGLVKNGGGAQSLSGNTSNYTGSTVINGGVLAVASLANGGSNSSIGASTSDAGNLVINGGALRYNGTGESTDRQFTLGANGGSLDAYANNLGPINFTSTAPVVFAGTGNRTLTLTGISTVDNSLSARIDNPTGGMTALTKTSTGTWILKNAASTYTGVTNISGGVLGVDKLANGGQASSIGASSNAATSLVIGSGSTLRYTGAGDTTDRLFTLSTNVSFIESSGTGAIVFSNTGSARYINNGNRTLALGGTNTGLNTMGGTIINGPGGVTQLAKNDSGTWVLTGNNSYTGDTVVNDGNLIIGNGGTTGNAGTGNVIVDHATSTLSFNRGDTFNFVGTISGAGEIAQIGAGTTILTGANTYTGATNVTAGTLRINGDQSGATGLTSVGSGGTLGGSGRIGGSVSIADGTLAPGNSPGTLTINGDLTLAAASHLAFEFGQANAPGAPLNDVVNVGGNLTLDGTIDVSVPNGGRFDIGLYRIFNYGGALTNNTLAVGALPVGTDPLAVFAQTSITGQVNLINASGVTLNFWDGAAGPKFNSAINGGDGVWQSGAGNDNWADVTGTVNAAFSDGTVAIFSATGGTVTVDDGPGAVRAGGMQFASDGYTITGDAVTLANAMSVIRVGDGTAAGAGYAATINSVLGGLGAKLVKTDLGTLVLAGANTYRDGTLIEAGTLSISSDANLGDAAGVVGIVDAALKTTANIMTGRAVALDTRGIFATDALTTLTVNGVVSGPGALVKEGGGTLTLAGTNIYAGGTTINAGSLQIGNGGTTGAITGDVVDNAALVFNRADGVAFAGTISGTGSLTKLGAGVLTLTADNSYAGTTTIMSGTLRLGAGGTTGMVAGDVVNNGSLVFDRGDEVDFARLISGTGIMEQAGSGTTILTASNSYAGQTFATAGTLLINGDQSAATGATTVFPSATLGGVGTIGGDVSVNGTLAPGDAAGPGTLTINGALSLAAGSRLAYDFGRSNVVGGPLNDLTRVGGDLDLGGTIDVTVSPGGSFDIGLYRVISYGGLLTDNGLALGVMPAGSVPAVQTSIIGQVNLVNSAGATIAYWDGAALVNKVDGHVNGGDGFWQNSAGNTNWADIAGQFNGPFNDGSFAIFSAAPGRVRVDNSLGAVTVSGMQFASDGYVIADQDVRLIGPLSIIRVGDGTLDGLGYTATIEAALTGDSQLVKTDFGTLVLSGTNSYTGGTRINLGTLQISSDANLGAAAGGLTFDGGTLHGTANITSARDIDMIGAGSIITDAGTTLVFNGRVTGAGDLIKDGAGALALNDTSSYAGLTIVRAGSLFVNGDQSAATGLTTVAAGATLGGHGIIGGGVVVANGGILAPGNSPGTLTINGDLALSSGSLLNFEFGQANVAGGALNDLVNVGGNLTLDGTLNVAVSAGGSFGPGVYRVFNYDGTLINNGLTVGGLPAGATATVQTSIAGQVNLVNTAGLAFNFWDGAAGPKNNGVINGGTGVWQSSAGNDNWTDTDGAVNAAYSDDAFAVFAGAGGIVTVDKSLGDVSAVGMQFAANGYTVTGGAVALVGPQSIIRVGDGGAAGAGITATVNAALSGDTRLVKTDAGTLVLGGANGYTGGTTISAGTVRVSSDANLGAATGGITLDGGTLATSASMASARDLVMASAGTISTTDATTFAFDGRVTGAGALTKAGAGTLVMTGDNGGYTGATNVAGGTLAVAGRLGGTLAVATGGRLEGTGSVGPVTNAGVVAPGRGGSGALIVNGDYTGSNGRLRIEAALGGDASPTTLLVVNGATAGTTTIDVVNRGGLGAQTREGVKIVDVAGASNGEFTLNGDYVFKGEQAVIAGAYGYRLYKGGVATPTDGDWYLRSSLIDPASPPDAPNIPLYQPGVPVYEAYGQALLSLVDLGTMQQRVGNRQWAPVEGGSSSGIWGRMQGNRSRPNAAFSTSLADTSSNSWKMELGADHVLSERGDGASLVLGVLGGYGETNTHVASPFGGGAIKAKGYGAGATLTWFGPQGFYVDSRAQLTWFDSRLTSGLLGTLADGNNGFGQAYSVEVGKRVAVGRTLSITPQAQMVYATVGFDRFTDPNGALVSSKLGDSLKTRWGVSIDRQDAKSHVYGIANLSYEWLDGTVTDVSGTRIARRNRRLWGELGVGGSVLINDRVTLYTEASANTAVNDFAKSYDLKGNIGLRLAF